MNKLIKIGGVSAILEAAIYVCAFIVYGAVLIYPEAGSNDLERLNFISENYLILAGMNLIGYVLFGILLSILTLAVYERLKVESPYLSKFAMVFGLIWVALVIASGMIGNIGLDTVIKLGAQDPEKAMVVWSSVGVITEGLGGGNEIVGGLWVLLLSVAAIKTFPKFLTALGILVGSAGICTIYPAEIFTEIFGLTQIIWFVVLGLFLIRERKNNH